MVIAYSSLLIVVTLTLLDFSFLILFLFSFRMPSATYLIQVHYPLPLALQITPAIRAGGLDDLQSTAERQSKFCQEKEKEVRACVERV